MQARTVMTTKRKDSTRQDSSGVQRERRGTQARSFSEFCDAFLRHSRFVMGQFNEKICQL